MIPKVTSGLTMMKIAVREPEQFVHPKTAFLIGFLYLTNMITLEVINLLMTMTYSTIRKVIQGHITFAINTEIPTLYYMSL